MINGKEIFLNPPGGKTATTPDPTMGDKRKDAAPGGSGAGAPAGGAGFVAGGGAPTLSPGGMDLGGLAGIAKAAGGLAKAAGSIPGLGGLGKAGALASAAGGLFGGGKSSGPSPDVGPVGIGDGKPGNF